MKSDNSLAGKVNDLSEELIEPEIMMDPMKVEPVMMLGRRGL